MPEKEERGRIGEVEKVVERGLYGPYAVVRDEELGAITLSLSAPAWDEKKMPDPGTFVVLSDIIKRRAGWRAGHGRFVRPSDQQQAKQSAAKQTASRRKQK